jgi:hypothetical protein
MPKNPESTLAKSPVVSPQIQMLENALRPLQIPFRPKHQEAVVKAASELLKAQGVEEKDQPLVVRSLVEDWAENPGAPNGTLLDLIKVGIKAGMPGEHGEALASSYPELFKSLMTFLPVTLIPGFISQAPLAADLALEQGMSATQISLTLAPQMGGLEANWKATEKLLQRLGAKPELDAQKVKDLLPIDQEMAEKRFAGSDSDQAAEIAGNAAQFLGFPIDLANNLRILCPSLDGRDPGFHLPYLQVLEFLCVTPEFFDHPPHYVYEFSPRGVIATDFFNDRFPTANTGNAVLNNSKSVEALDHSWANSKKAGKIRQATALAEILVELNSLPYPARRELSGWLRQWVRHIYSVIEIKPHLFPDGLDQDSAAINSLLDFTATDNTQTSGILEQRVCDALTTLAHPSADEWRSRGLGDPVNAANLPGKKLGDCDFQDIGQRLAVAYEPHGGALAAPYVHGHIKSLSRVIEARVEEWAGIADASEWRVHVVFIAHELKLDQAEFGEQTIEEVKVTFEFKTFSDFINEARNSFSEKDLGAALDLYVFQALNEQRNPQSLRDRVAEELSLTLVDPPSPS